MIAANVACRFHDVAVILSSLDIATRDELLACFRLDEREQLTAILDSIDHAESPQAEALIVELLHSLRWKSRQLDVSNADGIDLERWDCPIASLGGDEGAHLEDTSTSADPIDQALGNIPVHGLFELLEPQHPQLIAATLKLLHPNQVQSVLHHFSNAMQLEIADRMDHCEPLHADIAMELRCELMTYFATENSAHRPTIAIDRRRYA